MTRRVIAAIAVLSFTYGLSLWVLSGTLHLTENPNYAGSWELPLDSSGPIAVDTKGDIYCGSMMYQRIQIYNQDGTFVKGLFIPGPSGGWFDFQVDSDNLLHIATARGNRLLVLDRAGRVLEDQENLPNGFDAEIARDDVSYTIDGQHNFYQVDRAYLLFPVIRKTDMYGSKTVVVQQPLSIWLLGVPLPAFGFQLLGFFLFVASYLVAGRMNARGAKRGGKKGMSTF